MIEWAEFGQKSLDFIYRPINQDARINILEGSVRSSKTVTMIPKWIRYMIEGPPGLLLMTGVSKDTIYDNVLRDLFDTVGESNYRYNRQTGDLLMYGRQLKVVGAKDDGSEKYIRGKTLAGAYSDEATLMPPEFLKQLMNRLSVKGAKMYLTTNPDTPSHPLYTDYIINEKRRASGMVDVIHFELEDNPNLTDEYIEFIKGAYAGLFYQRSILGLWVMGEGAIYDMWTDENVYDECPVVQGVWDAALRYVAIDYGTTNPMVYLDIVDTGDYVLIDREYYYDSKVEGKQKTDSQYADDFKAFIEGVPCFAAVVDPSAASFKVQLLQNGVSVREADNDVLNGISLVSTLIQKRILRINRRCKNTIREMQSYVWNTKTAMEKGKEEPVKKNDHGPDAVRYGLKTMFNENRLAYQ